MSNNSHDVYKPLEFDFAGCFSIIACIALLVIGGIVVIVVQIEQAVSQIKAGPAHATATAISTYCSSLSSLDTQTQRQLIALAKQYIHTNHLSLTDVTAMTSYTAGEDSEIGLCQVDACLSVTGVDSYGDPETTWLAHFNIYPFQGTWFMTDSPQLSC